MNLDMKSSWKSLLEQLDQIQNRLDDPRQTEPYVEAFGELVKNHVFYDDELPADHHLVHYTSWQSTLSILKDDHPALRMYNYESANDPLEGALSRRAWGELEGKAQWINEHLPAHEKILLRHGRSSGTTYGCAFSSNIVGIEDDLTFWRFYGNDGEGCSLLLGGRPPYRREPQRPWRIYRVRYLDEEQRNRDVSDEEVDGQIATCMGQLLKSGEEIAKHVAGTQSRKVANDVAGGVRKILSGYRHLAKSSGFRDELEWRIIAVAPEVKSVHFDEDADGLVKRYIRGPALKDLMITNSAVTIGPRVRNSGAAREYVQRLLSCRGIDLDVRLSEQNYRSDISTS